MIAQRKQGLQAVLILLQSILIAFSLVFCLGLTTLFTSLSWAQVSRYPIYMLVMMIGLFIESMHREAAGKQFQPMSTSFPGQHQLSLTQTVYAMGTLFVFLVLTKDEFVSRISLIVSFPVLYFTLLWSNRSLWSGLARLLFHGTRKGRILLIGSPEKALQLRSWLRDKEMYGMETVGLLCESPDDAPDLDHLHLLGTIDDAERVIREQAITQVILLQLPEKQETHRHFMSVMERNGVRLLIVNNLGEKLHHPVIYLEDEGHHFISLREEPLENPVNRIAKRTLDIAIALPVVLFLLPPVALVVWIIQRIYAPGPLFFKQVRAGLLNQSFVIWKFRTMYVDNPDATRQATKGDQRVFPRGHFLRRFSIDELPQFWNVLQGNMSLTGPRPHLIEHNEQFARQIANFPIRTVVKPGITGLAQVRGFRGEARTPEDIAKRLESDLTYLENWRLTLDLAIMVRTLWQMFFPPKTAY